MMETKEQHKTTVNAGMGFTSFLALAFIVLKLTHVINWSWLWVLAPIWISAVKKTIMKIAHGMVHENIMSDAPMMRKAYIYVRVTKDENGATLSMSNIYDDISLMIPLEEVQDIIKLTGEIAQ